MAFRKDVSLKIYSYVQTDIQNHKNKITHLPAHRIFTNMYNINYNSAKSEQKKKQKKHGYEDLTVFENLR